MKRNYPRTFYVLGFSQRNIYGFRSPQTESNFEIKIKNNDEKDRESNGHKLSGLGG